MWTTRFFMLALGLCGQALSGADGPEPQSCPLEPVDLWRRMALDPAGQRLYFPVADGVRVTDLEGRALGAVTDLGGVHSVTVAPELGLGICSQVRAGLVSLFNLDSLEVEKELRTTGGRPEAVLFDPACRRIFAFNTRGRSATAFDAFGGAVAGTLPLGGRPGTAVADGRGRLFVTLRDTREVLLADTWRLAILARIPVPDLEDPSGPALDPARRRLFVAGANGLLAVLDSVGGERLATLAIGAEAGAVGCDPVSGEAWVPHRDGSVTVVREDASGRYQAAAMPIETPALLSPVGT